MVASDRPSTLLDLEAMYVSYIGRVILIGGLIIERGMVTQTRSLADHIPLVICIHQRIGKEFKVDITSFQFAILIRGARTCHLPARP